MRNKCYEINIIFKSKLFYILLLFKVFIIWFTLYKGDFYYDYLKVRITSINNASSAKYNGNETNFLNSSFPGFLPWHERKDKLDILNSNIVYMKFNIPRAVKLEKVNIIFIVSTAPARNDRRSAIRDTWWSQCKSSAKVSIKCVFLTDWRNESSVLGRSLLIESNKFKDMYFQNLSGGYDFGKRFLYHMVWSMQNIDFDYFLRLDDDYFFCMERFLQEVPMPPKKIYHWGWVHCIPNIVRPEESIILLSRDLIEIFLGQDPEKILCNRWADQMIGIWNNELHLPKFYRHDSRLHHDPPAQNIESFKTKQNICTEYIGVHGSYPIQMKILWNHRGPNNYDVNKTLDSYSKFCGSDSIMNWMLFVEAWRVEPKLCKNDPHWGGTIGITYIGRQGQ